MDCPAVWHPAKTTEIKSDDGNCEDRSPEKNDCLQDIRDNHRLESAHRRIRNSDHGHRDPDQRCRGWVEAHHGYQYYG